MHAFFCILSFILGLSNNMDQRFVLIYIPVCLQSIFVGSFYLFYSCFIINCAVVYPETKGVPLEEMDAVFGEGASFIISL